MPLDSQMLCKLYNNIYICNKNEDSVGIHLNLLNDECIDIEGVSIKTLITEYRSKYEKTKKNIHHLFTDPRYFMNIPDPRVVRDYDFEV